MSSRSSEVDALVFGKSGEGGAGGGPRDEIVVDVLVRGRGTGLEANELGQGRKKRGVERSLEGWSAAKGGLCLLTDLEELKGVWGRVNLRDEVGNVLAFDKMTFYRELLSPFRTYQTRREI